MADAAFASLAMAVCVCALLVLCVSKGRNKKAKSTSSLPVSENRASGRRSAAASPTPKSKSPTPTKVDSPRDSFAVDMAPATSSKFASRFSATRSSATSIQSFQSFGAQSSDGVRSPTSPGSDGEVVESDNDLLSEDEENMFKPRNFARRQSTEFDRDSITNGDFAAPAEDTGRAAAMASRLMANLRNEPMERKRHQEIMERQNSNSPVVAKRPLSAVLAPGAEGVLPSVAVRSSTLGSMRPLSQEMGLAVGELKLSSNASSSSSLSANLPPLRAGKAMSPFKVRYLPEPAPANGSGALPSTEPVDLREKIKEAKRKLKPVQKEGEDSDGEAVPQKCTLLGDCTCANCR